MLPLGGAEALHPSGERNDAGMGPGKEVSSIMVGMQGEFSMSCFCSVGVT